MILPKQYTVLGLMSGSSLDGLDLAVCNFQIKQLKGREPGIRWELKQTETIPYSEKWIKRLKNAPQLSAKKLLQLHVAYGKYLGKKVERFLAKQNTTVDFVSSHGHTIFHYPDKSFTTQIGDGAAIAARSGIPVICDFRTTDIALGGQGTPIAPAADKYLFPGYDFYLNIGGISNITTTLNHNLIAFDIGPANQVLNHLAQQVNKPYDNNGEIAASGNKLPGLLSQLNDIRYFSKAYPKSLDNQWISKNVLPIFDQFEGSTTDKLHTATYQQAFQLAKTIQDLKSLESKKEYRLLITGGGAFNGFLIQQLKELVEVNLHIPAPEIVAFKEAALMALMGVLRKEQIPNCFASVTGARRDSIGGAIYCP